MATSTLAFVLSTAVKVLIQEMVHQAFAAKKEWMRMMTSAFVILLGTSGSPQMGRVAQSSQQDNANDFRDRKVPFFIPSLTTVAPFVMLLVAYFTSTRVGVVL